MCGGGGRGPGDTSMGKTAKEALTEFSEKLIAALEAGTAPWQRTWEPGECPTPYNGVTGYPYRGSNLLALLLFHGGAHRDPRWAGFRQIAQAGGGVRKGEKGVPILVAVTNHGRGRRSDPKPDDSDPEREGREPQTEAEGESGNGERKWGRARTTWCTHHIFNFEQADGLPPEPEGPQAAPESEAERNLAAIAGGTGIRVVHAPHATPSYNRIDDSIRMPDRDRFDSGDHYRGTLLHELAHATGHPSRLKRWTDARAERTKAEYAEEELRVEIAAVMTGAALGVGHRPDVEEHTRYMAHWVDLLKIQPERIRTIAAEAQAIKDWLTTAAESGSGNTHRLEAA